MIKKECAALLAAFLVIVLPACSADQQPEPEPLQGVVEFEEQLLAFEVPGRVQRVHIQRGDVVSLDSPLVSLDDTLERSVRDSNAGQLDAARAQVDLVRAGARPEEVKAVAARLHAARTTERLVEKNLERERTLLEHGAVPETRVEQIENELSRATAERKALEQQLHALQRGARSEELRVAESTAFSAASALELHDARLDRYVLHATDPGEILDIHVEVGEVVAPGAPVVTIADTSRPYADVFVPLPLVGEVQQGARATLHVDGYSEPFSGTVEHVARRTEFTPRFLFSERERPNLVVRVRIRIDDPDRILHAGIPAFVTLTPAGAPS
jgi:multidrug resistance efflux pump